jgi:hypothetical protein
MHPVSGSLVSVMPTIALLDTLLTSQHLRKRPQDAQPGEEALQDKGRYDICAKLRKVFGYDAPSTADLMSI